jgi:NAD(P)-dependent dehydrogenase (short-subunit alcohol dehydrogenase family)
MAIDEGGAMTGRLEGKVALVTGAASGIGQGIARRFAAEGARLVLGDLNGVGLDAMVDELGPDRCMGVAGDVTAEDDVAALAAAGPERFGRLDVVVANAGGGAFAPILDHPLEEFRRVVDLCLTSAFLTVKHAGGAMVRAGNGGSVVAIASINARQASRGMSAYCAAKAGVAMFCEVAALELGPHGIRVNAIAPGLVETPATATFFAMPGVVEEFVENTTMGRFAQPADVAAVATFLASDEASYVSGCLYPVDGGALTGRYPNLFTAIERLGGLPGQG